MGAQVLALEASHPIGHAISLHRSQPDTVPIVHESGTPIGILRRAISSVDPDGPESHLPCRHFVEKASFVRVGTLDEAAKLALESNARFLIMLDATGTSVIADLDRAALQALVDGVTGSQTARIQPVPASLDDDQRRGRPRRPEAALAV